MKKIAVFSLAVFGCFALFGSEAVTGLVKKYPLNVRAGAGTKYTALIQLDKNHQVTIRKVSREWLAIAPPENTRVWVLQQFIKNGRLTSGVNFRSGPGTGYEALGTGKRGMKVEVIGKATPSGWIQIAAPESLDFYIGRPAVEVKTEQLKKLPVFKVPMGRQLPNKELITLEGNFTSPGKPVTVSGYVYSEEKSHINSVSHVFYELKGESDLIPKYLVMPNRNDLDKFKDKKVTLIGDSYNVKNWQLPLLVVKIARLDK